MLRKLIAECLGTFSLLATVVGSGIVAERLADGNVAIALLGNTMLTGAILVVLITVFGSIPGAHFNPAVTLSFALRREIPPNAAGLFVLAQIFGGAVGMFAAHVMFDNPIIDPSTTDRTGMGQWAGEFVATFGLVGKILACLRARPDFVSMAVGLYITAAYWFTSSTTLKWVVQLGTSSFATSPIVAKRSWLACRMARSKVTRSSAVGFEPSGGQPSSNWSTRTKVGPAVISGVPNARWP